MPKRLTELADTVRAGADAAIRTERLMQQMYQTLVMTQLAETPRFKEPLRLLGAGYKMFSQNQEDGMIAEVFRRIGTGTRRFIEFGVQDGLECNSAYLLTQGWSGAWIEGSDASVAGARAAFTDYPIEIVNRYVTVENADELITALAKGEELDLLSIDVDSIDYWLWQAIVTVKPRLVVIEYNAS